MKTHCTARLVLVILTLISVHQAKAQYYNNPESAAFDELRNCWYVSNYGDGKIIRVDTSGAQTVFSDTLGRVAGLLIVDDVLYAASNDTPFIGTMGFDLDTRQLVRNIQIPVDGMVNDITTDGYGFLYVTDFYDNKIYRVNLATDEVWIFVSSGLPMPNGIVYDPALDRLFVSCQNASGRPIKIVDLADSSVSIGVYTNLGGVDGLALDNENRLYFSAWQTDAIYRYGLGLSGSAELVSSGHLDPADIAINLRDNVLAVPNYTRNTVDFVSLAPDAVDETPIPTLTGLSQCYPNPFNSRAVIEYSLNTPGEVRIDVFDALGRLHETLIRETQTPGRHRLIWSAASHPSGTYFYRIMTGDRVETRKIVLLK
ncbi:T9SS type A sorting domain-containing protein [bacterium]|nr:T9SS type A sorting domain-containing protein [bacterium]MBU1984513.1 T9SS type A sorting domain-containing protein [bacterium]